MGAGRISVFRRMVVTPVFALLACGLISMGVSSVSAAGNPVTSAFKDPYNGGIKLPGDGGEPGRAYMAYMKAVYRKDHRQLCQLMGAQPAEMEQCLGQKQELDSIIALYSHSKSQKVVGGFMKGDEATLNVRFTPYEGPPGNGFAVMKKSDNRWMLSRIGGSASTTINVEASATVDMASGSSTASVRFEQTPAADYTGPALGRWVFAGDDNQGDAWTGTLDIEKLDPDRYDASKYQLHVVLEMKSEKDEGRGIDTPCAWQPGKREVSCITEIGEYTAVLSGDRKSLIDGRWNALEPEDWSSKKFRVVKTGTWTAAYTSGGQADPGPAAAAEASSAGADPEFALIKITPNKKEYAGRCPAAIAFTADITFKTPLPEKFSYRWEFSNGKKTKDRVVKPPRNGHLSVREVWRGGKAGEELEASARFVAEAGDNSMVLDPPGVKVSCK